MSHIQKRLIIGFICLAILATTLTWAKKQSAQVTQPPRTASASLAQKSESELDTNNAQASTTYHLPVAGFFTRITKKHFGTFVSPSSSPIQPERFSGYHTGVDVEYADQDEDIDVRAIASGTVLESRVIAGYGGVIIVRFTIGDKHVVALYGHIRPTTLPIVGLNFNSGDILGKLGTAYTTETDNERRHLHFSVRAVASTDYRGYVSDESQLKDWVDPIPWLEDLVN